MAKQTGLGDQLFVGGRDLSGDTGSLSAIAGGPGALAVTGINKSAMERIGGDLDGRILFSSWFNPTAGRAHPVLAALPTADVLVTYFRGTTLGNPAASLLGKQVNYDPTRGADGSLTIDVQAVANGFGLEWGRTLSAGTDSHSSATDGTGVDFAASTSFGLQAYLHVFSFTGTDATLKLQESSDDASGDAYADVTGGGFAQITGAQTTERIATANNLTVEQWLRVISTTSGGFSEMTFAVTVTKNTTVPVF